MKTRERYRWLDFSGAPAILIAKKIAAQWRGTTNSKTVRYSQPSFEEAATDYDRCIQIAMKGDGILRLSGTDVLVLYTEYDLHTWEAEYQIISCSGSAPPLGDLKKIKWGMPKKVLGTRGTPFFWHAIDTDYLLMNLAADGRGLSEEDVLQVTLTPGRFRVESCYLAGEHRLIYEEESKEKTNSGSGAKSKRHVGGREHKISERDIVDAIRRDRESCPRGV